MKVTEAMMSAPGAFIPTSMPAKAPGMTPVSRVQHMNSISFRLHLVRRSGKVQANTDTGRATSMKMATTASPGSRYFPISAKFTCEPSRMKMNMRMISAVVMTYSSSFSCSRSSILKPKASLLPITMPNTNTAMKPEECMPSAPM